MGASRKSEGDFVRIDEVLVEIETDKAAMGIPAPASGTLGKILAPPSSSASESGNFLAASEAQAAWGERLAHDIRTAGEAPQAFEDEGGADGAQVGGGGQAAKHAGVPAGHAIDR